MNRYEDHPIGLLKAPREDWNPSYNFSAKDHHPLVAGQVSESVLTVFSLLLENDATRSLLQAFQRLKPVKFNKTGSGRAVDSKLTWWFYL